VTVAQLITKLQALNPNLTVLTDRPATDSITLSNELRTLIEPVVVATGIAYKIYQDSPSGHWVSYTPWEDTWAGVPLNGVASVYIGTGDSIITPLWEKR
jgi:hypothetical protein